MENFWNERYNSPEYMYGKKPNDFFASVIEKCTPGSMLLPAEGEGRNAVFAALNGWKVTAFDYSPQASQKALQLAEDNKVSIDYRIHSFEDFSEEDSKYNLVGLIYTHLPSSDRAILFPKLVKSLKPGGTILMEVFSKNQLGKQSGGPKDPDLLYDLKELQQVFEEMDISVLEEKIIVLDEGPFHQGEASVIRIVAEKRI